MVRGITISTCERGARIDHVRVSDFVATAESTFHRMVNQLHVNGRCRDHAVVASLACGLGSEHHLHVTLTANPSRMVLPEVSPNADELGRFCPTNIFVGNVKRQYGFLVRVLREHNILLPATTPSTILVTVILEATTRSFLLAVPGGGRTPHHVRADHDQSGNESSAATDDVMVDPTDAVDDQAVPNAPSPAAVQATTNTASDDVPCGNCGCFG